MRINEMTGEMIENTQNPVVRDILRQNKTNITTTISNKYENSNVFLSKFNFCIDMKLLELHAYFTEKILVGFLENEIATFLQNLLSRFLLSEQYKNTEILSFNTLKNNLVIQNSLLFYVKLNFTRFPVLITNDYLDVFCNYEEYD